MQGKFMKKVSKRFYLLLAVALLFSSIFTTTAFAATSYNPGEYYLGHFTFTNSNIGAMRIYKANKMRLKIAWKKGEASASDINLTVDVTPENSSHKSYSVVFKPYMDTDGKDSDGYYYVVTDWFPITYGGTYRLIYDASTCDGGTGTGHYRQGDVHTWIELGN